MKAARAAAVAEAQLHLLLALMQATVASQAAAFGLPPEQTLAAIARCQVWLLLAACLYLSVLAICQVVQV